MSVSITIARRSRPPCRMRAAAAILALSVAMTRAATAVPVTASPEGVAVVSTWAPRPLEPGEQVVFENQDGTTMTMVVGSVPTAVGSLKPGYEPLQTPAGPVVGWGMFQLAQPYTSRSGITLPAGTRAMGRFILGPTAYTVIWDHFVDADGKDLAVPPDTAHQRQ